MDKMELVRLKRDTSWELDRLLEDLATLGIRVNKTAFCSFAVDNLIDSVKDMMKTSLMRAASANALYAKSIKSLSKKQIAEKKEAK